MSTGLQLSELQYSSVLAKGVPEHVTALEDGGAEVAMVDTCLIRHLNLHVLGKIIIRPVVGKTVKADLVLLKIKQHSAQPYTNIALCVAVISAACKLATDVNFILCCSVVKEMQELKTYDVLKCPKISSEVVVDAASTRSVSRQNQLCDNRTTVQRVDAKMSDDDGAVTPIASNDDTVPDVVYNTH